MPLPTDDYVTPFGIRELKFTPGTGLFINGVSYEAEGRVHAPHRGAGWGRRSRKECGSA